MKHKLSMPKKDALVICFCAGFLMLTLGSIGTRGRHHARSILCQRNLSKLSIAALMYADDNNDKFYGYTRDLFINANASYIGEGNKFYICPETEVSQSSFSTFWGSSRNTWMWTSSAEELFAGSYALNGWFYDNSRGDDSFNTGIVNIVGSDFNDICWPTQDSISSPNTTPVFSDSIWVDGWPRETDYIVPEFKFNHPWQTFHGSDSPARGHIQRMVIDRHLGAINVSFADGHVAPVELKELWSLTWHKDWNIQHDVTRTDGSPIYPEE